MSEEKTYEEIEQENYDKMLDAMVTHSQATDDTLTFSSDEEQEQYKKELSENLGKLAGAETDEEFAELLEENQDDEAFNAALSFAATQMKPEEYVVRGALLKCCSGSHHRKLNLPKCHGVYIGQNPVMHSGDCKAGIDAMVNPDINITSFGVCKGTNSKPTDTDRNISLAKEILDESGIPIAGEISDGRVKGVQCKACIQNSTWENVHNSTQIGEGGEYAITTNSFLVCQHGGVISVVTSGQETVIDVEETNKTIMNETDINTDNSLSRENMLENSLSNYNSAIENHLILMSKERTARPDSGLIGVPNEEISRRARDHTLSGEERQRYKKEEKVRGDRNRQKRGKKSIEIYEDETTTQFNFTYDFLDDMAAITGLTGAALIIYLTISIGSRFVFPVRNLIPI